MYAEHSQKREILNASFMRCSRPLITWREQDLEGGPKVGEALMPFTKFIFVVKFYLRKLARRSRVYGLRSVLGGRNCRVWSTILKAILSMACYADKKWMHGGVARSRPSALKSYDNVLGDSGLFGCKKGQLPR